MIGDRVNLGMNAVVHQRTVLGHGAMIGMGTPVTRDVPPFTKVFGSPARIRGVNTVGMERAGIPAEQRDALVEAYTAGEFFVTAANLPETLSELHAALVWWQRQGDLRVTVAELTRTQ
ncbi:hypothetical protein OOT08_12245 [Leucobacter sp. M11]|nr:hypothetical protein [Leucobacter sp. M11]